MYAAKKEVAFRIIIQFIIMIIPLYGELFDYTYAEDINTQNKEKH